MTTLPLDHNTESARLAALYEADLLDTESEPEFDEIVEIASEICGVTISTITLVDAERQWFKARKGLTESETGLDVSFCALAIRQLETFVVEDSRTDIRLQSLEPLREHPDVRFYAGVPLRLEDGHAVGTLCIAAPEPRQLSEREARALTILARHVVGLIELRRTRRKMNELLIDLKEFATTQERITQLATRLLSVIAHDVRGPLSSVIEVLDVAPDEDLVELRDTIQRHAIVAKSLLDDILSWARTMIQGGPIASDIHVETLVASVVSVSASDAAAKNTTITVHREIEHLHADPNILRFVLHTFITNAVKFTESGTIDVYIKHDEAGRVTVIVRDTGTGMSDRTRERLFDWQRRGGEYGTRRERGSGVALLLVKDFLDLIGGTITVDSKQGIGTTMTVTLGDV
ncbi:MAG TPA: hypothetical protein DIS79_04485 [Bacteroidetes bacterium]|nr:hypothetical protein [Bacteroidota bacterium]HRK04812.1 HAMP domain-containing sensor histidine kinase [Chlorobiota bacterium]